MDSIKHYKGLFYFLLQVCVMVGAIALHYTAHAGCNTDDGYKYIISVEVESNPSEAYVGETTEHFVNIGCLDGRSWTCTLEVQGGTADPSSFSGSGTVRQSINVTWTSNGNHQVGAYVDGDDTDIDDLEYNYWNGLCAASNFTTVTVIGAEIVDARAFGPKMESSGNAGLDNSDLRSTVVSTFLVDGALCDGSSLCLLRVVPDDTDLDGWSVDFCSYGGSTPGASHELGSIHPGDPNSLPTLPAGDRIIHGPSSCGSSSGSLTDGLGFYRPPNNFLIGQDTEESASFDIVFKKDGVEKFRKPFTLVRTPIIAAHGIFRSDVIWGDIWKNNPAYKVNFKTLNYEPDASEGPPENYMKLAKLINDTLQEYRAGYGAQLNKIAAARADVIGHSQGGQLARFYISDMGGNWGAARDPDANWPLALNGRSATATDGSWPYLRDDNYGAGSIRRLVTLGSPFKGSAWASLVAPIVEPDAAYATTFFATSGFGLALADEKYRVWAWLNPDDYQDGYRALVCLNDNSPGSVVGTKMDEGTYPAGQKTVRWLPVVGIAQNDMGDNWGAVFGGSFQAFYNLLDLALGGALPGSNDFDQIAELNPAVSDGVVPDYSQCDVEQGSTIRGRSYEFTVHDRFPVPATEAEYDRAAIVNDVLRILSSEGNAGDFFPLQ